MSQVTNNLLGNWITNNLLYQQVFNTCKGKKSFLFSKNKKNKVVPPGVCIAVKCELVSGGGVHPSNANNFMFWSFFFVDFSRAPLSGQYVTLFMDLVFIYTYYKIEKKINVRIADVSLRQPSSHGVASWLK